MKRLHVHLHVDDLERNVDFYSTLFGSRRTVRRADYAKWRLEDPRVNFAITRGRPQTGLGHLGIEVDTRAELSEVAGRTGAADIADRPEPGALCCYARSDKHWFSDPQSISWELFHTVDQIETFDGTPASVTSPAKRCCA